MENDTLTIIIVAIIIGLFIVFTPNMMQNSYSQYSMMSWMFGGFGFMWIFGFLFMTLIIIALILLIVWLIKQLQK
jgi:chromate transport protein ChrA